MLITVINTKLYIWTIRQNILNAFFRYANYYRNVLGIRANDVVHLLTVGEHLEIFYAALGLWHLGAVPAFGESSLSEEALIDQVVIFPCHTIDQINYLKHLGIEPECV